MGRLAESTAGLRDAAGTGPVLTMTAPGIVDPAGVLGQALADASPDLMRHLLATVINSLLSAEADAVCGAEWGQPSPERVSLNRPRFSAVPKRVAALG